MTVFEMIKYHGQEYPDDIPLRIEEVAAHFDIQKINSRLGRSLHTEYSYGKRKLDSPLIAKFAEIKSAQKDGVPQLWKNESWARQFAEFIFALSEDGLQPKIIEVHPPFDDYSDINSFASTYSVFESEIKNKYPETAILVENRCGSVYHGGKFVLSKVKDIEAICEQIERRGLSLQIACDVPQIYTAHSAQNQDAFIKLLEQTKPYRNHIGGVHLWGKRRSESGRKVAHCGDLDSYFGDPKVKQAFLHIFNDCFDDDAPRKMVLEVNSGNEDLKSIIGDLQSVGIRFV